MAFTGPVYEIPVSGDIVLVRLRLESTVEIFNAIDLHRNALRQWLPFVDNTRKKEDTEIFIKSIIQAHGAKRDIVYEIRHSDKFAGLIAFKEFDRWNKKSEMGYWLIPEFEGQGIMTMACKAMIDCGFSHMKLNRIQVKVGIGNARSSRIPEKLGFRFEGIERAGEKFASHYIDLEVFSLLRKEWENQ
ncbi:MAG: GNAT family N-acetyltransferase [Bacteroidales bacterium]|nr:GNAT family N-acetyltransferase [Bacteroidales bacterium]